VQITLFWEEKDPDMPELTLKRDLNITFAKERRRLRSSLFLTHISAIYLFPS
jgi:hypothetical protein